MTYDVLRDSLFARNGRATEQTRSLLDRFRIVAVNILGGAGCGKTSLLERVIPQLQSNFGVAVLAADPATTKDAARLTALGVPVIQLLTEGGSFLTPTLVQQGIARLPLDDVDLLLIENVGNPICPCNIDLGEHHRLTCLSATEGDDQPAKNPRLFKRADLVVFTKMDLEAVTDFDPQQAARGIRALDPNKAILYTSAIRGASTQAVVDWLQAKLGSMPSDLLADADAGSRQHATLARC